MTEPSPEIEDAASAIVQTESTFIAIMEAVKAMPEASRAASIAITHMETATLWAVKSLRHYQMQLNELKAKAAAEVQESEPDGEGTEAGITDDAGA